MHVSGKPSTTDLEKPLYAMMMAMVPEAWQNDALMPQEHTSIIHLASFCMS